MFGQTFVHIGLHSVNTSYTLHRSQKAKWKLIHILLSRAYEMQYFVWILIPGNFPSCVYLRQAKRHKINRANSNTVDLNFFSSAVLCWANLIQKFIFSGHKRNLFMLLFCFVGSIKVVTFQFNQIPSISHLLTCFSKNVIVNYKPAQYKYNENHTKLCIKQNRKQKNVHLYNNINSQLDATIIILLIISISSACFGR